ncbi:MAG: adenylate/guanylate cyclase domain-containing protein [Ignavibacteriales bacterium]|nr:adenylate/guanylate cyclase domain-containing protein [Ignavibacteriales bacterium]
MEPKLNEKLLDEKLTELEKAKQWSPRVISKLETLLRSGDDFSLFRVNPVKFGTEKNISEHEAIDLFLYATKIGLLHMNWEMLCPSCGDVVSSFRSLKTVHAHVFCNLCQLEKEASLDDFICISFTVSPLIRQISYHNPGQLSVEDFYFKYHLSADATYSGGVRFVDILQSLMKALSYIEPREKKTFSFDVTNGWLIGYDFITGAMYVNGIKENVEKNNQSLSLQFSNGKFESNEISLSAGTLTIDIENPTDKRISVIFINKPPEISDENATFPPFLTGKKLLTSQTFRDLFRTEVIQGTEGLTVKDLTILFTDLKGSTALYDRIGDLKAFSLVHQHFESLGKVINRFEGATVKTIGDAIMATFIKPVDGVQAALGMLEEIANFNKGFSSKEIILKIGVHKGPSIAVTLNDRLDYFGQTVNIASRVQGLADADEIYISDDVYNDKAVRDVLKQYNVEESKAKLRGIEDEMKVYKIASNQV